METNILINIIGAAIVIFFTISLGMFFKVIIEGFQCEHKNKVTRTIYTSHNCETTADFCKDCSKQVSEAKTDCR
ncbi:MAG: hypothetical protein K2P85_00485 [Flavobacteriaceae bacterium]|nr:hypothetical protein [Flavobacteriaceae bacterium]